MPRRVVPDRGQVPEYSIEPPGPERRDVFHDRVGRSYLANETVELPPEPGAFAVEPEALAGRADVLTGKPAGDDFNVDAMISEIGTPGQCLRRTRHGKPSRSQNATVRKPALSRPREIPPMPANRSKTCMGSLIPNRDAPRTGRPAR
jgi:hypothetical protein